MMRVYKKTFSVLAFGTRLAGVPATFGSDKYNQAVPSMCRCSDQFGDICCCKRQSATGSKTLFDYWRNKVCLQR